MLKVAFKTAEGVCVAAGSAATPGPGMTESTKREALVRRVPVVTMRRGCSLILLALGGWNTAARATPSRGR
jgi:hypothetical protein